MPRVRANDPRATGAATPTDLPAAPARPARKLSRATPRHAHQNDSTRTNAPVPIYEIGRSKCPVPLPFLNGFLLREKTKKPKGEYSSQLQARDRSLHSLGITFFQQLRYKFSARAALLSQ